MYTFLLSLYVRVADIDAPVNMRPVDARIVFNNFKIGSKSRGNIKMLIRISIRISVKIKYYESTTFTVL
jgi:hypothetical protein